MTGGHVAVIDIGKTNAKLALVRGSDLAEIAVMTRPNHVLPGPPYPHVDTEALWGFILSGLSEMAGRHDIAAITVTTHGAAGALLDASGALAAPILDYEHPGPESLAAEYDAIRPPFAETGAPRLAMGLNLGAQLHWQFARDPGLRARCRHVVTYPQYWGHRLTGRAASDLCSLGCHTDLWNPHRGTVSSLPATLGIADRMAPPLRPGAVLGPILPALARRTGLGPGTPVHCGIHDSNASLVPHLVALEPPFSVVSSGTWVIAMAVGGAAVALDPGRDTLVNVSAFGDAVPSARFMGGREHDLALGPAPAEASDAHMIDILTRGILLLPALAPETGPFQGRTARWVGDAPAMGTGPRSAAVGLYLGLVTAHCLALIGHRGPVIVEGPLARNRACLWMLGAATSAPVHPMASATGTSQGAALTVLHDAVPERREAPLAPAPQHIAALLAPYARAWQAEAGTAAQGIR